MGCVKRERGEVCSHYICPRPDKSGYECVDMAEGFCEIGDSCFDECEHSWKKGTEKGDRAELAWDAYLEDKIEPFLKDIEGM